MALPQGLAQKYLKNKQARSENVMRQAEVLECYLWVDLGVSLEYFDSWVGYKNAVFPKQAM